MATYYMPDDFADLATAYAGMVSGVDDLIVRDGTYTGPNNRNLDPGGKLVTVASENGPFTCIFDAEDNSCRFFYLHSGETNSFIVDGIQFKKTNLNVNGGKGGFAYATGATVLSPTFRNCIITDCKIVHFLGGWGSCVAAYSDADVVFENCLIYGCHAVGSCVGYAEGPGSRVCFYNCTIMANTCTSSTSGAGFRAQAWGDFRLYNCIVYNNQYKDWYADTSQTWSYCYNTCYKISWGSCHYSGANITLDPLHVVGPLGSYYLSCIAAGEGADSPCLDAGNDGYAPAGWNALTTRTDEALDSSPVDMGFHWPPVSSGDPGADMMMQLTS